MTACSTGSIAAGEIPCVVRQMRHHHGHRAGQIMVGVADDGLSRRPNDGGRLGTAPSGSRCAKGMASSEPSRAPGVQHRSSTSKTR
jgi:hypothetical protein